MADFFESYYTNGQRHFEIAYEGGKLHGPMRRWSQNGALILERYYANDMLEGPSKRWYENGVLREDCSYHEDKLEGFYTQYDASGKPVMKVKFKAGELQEDTLTNGE